MCVDEIFTKVSFFLFLKGRGRPCLANSWLQRRPCAKAFRRGWRILRRPTTAGGTEEDLERWRRQVRGGTPQRRRRPAVEQAQSVSGDFHEKKFVARIERWWFLYVLFVRLLDLVVVTLLSDTHTVMCYLDTYHTWLYQKWVGQGKILQRGEFKTCEFLV